MQQHPRGNGLAQLGLAFARPGKTDGPDIRAGVERQLEFAGRGHIHAIDQRAHKAHQRRHGIGLDGVVQVHALRQHLAHCMDARSDQGTVVSVERRLADPLSQHGKRQTADLQFIAGCVESIHILLSSVDGPACHWGCAAAADSPSSVF